MKKRPLQKVDIFVDRPHQKGALDSSPNMSKCQENQLTHIRDGRTQPLAVLSTSGSYFLDFRACIPRLEMSFSRHRKDTVRLFDLLHSQSIWYIQAPRRLLAEPTTSLQDIAYRWLMFDPSLFAVPMRLDARKAEARGAMISRCRSHLRNRRRSHTRLTSWLPKYVTIFRRIQNNVVK